MFYSGDLQSGIQKALSESKCVVCFVVGNSEEDKSWEDDLLEDLEILQNRNEKAVTLRIPAESREASFLTAYYPVSTFPTILIIKDGSLRSRLDSGTERSRIKQDFLQALEDASSLGNSSTRDITQPPQAFSEPLAQIGAGGTNVYTPSSEPPLPTGSDQPKNTSISNSKSKIADDTQAKEADATKTFQAQLARDQRKRKQEARLERDRILQQIEADKAQRREKEALRKAQVTSQHDSADASVQSAIGQPSNMLKKGKNVLGRYCNLQVRCFDGSTLRRRFPSDQTLATHVRGWLELEGFKQGSPYTFRQILTPLPNRTITESEEAESLEALSLTPSATLVIVPARNASTAYAYQPSAVSKYTTQLYSLLAELSAVLLQYVRVFLNVSQAPSAGERDESTHQNTAESTSTQADPASRIKIRRLFDQDEKNDHQFYNGNQLNFEPRKDTDEDEQ